VNDENENVSNNTMKKVLVPKTSTLKRPMTANTKSHNNAMMIRPSTAKSTEKE